jgi:hypothetical protein
MKMNYKAGFFVVLAGMGMLATFTTGYAIGVSKRAIGPSCDPLWTGTIPDTLLPTVRQKYPDVNSTQLYTIFSCVNGPTDTVKNCALIQQGDIPSWLSNVVNVNSVKLYSCRDF